MEKGQQNSSIARKKLFDNRLFIILFINNAFLFIWSATLNPHLGPFYLSRGISLANIGLLTAIGPVIALIMQPLWGILSDKTGKHMLILRIVIFAAAVTVFAYYRANMFVGFAIATALFQIFCCGLLPLNDTISITQVTKHRYKFSSVRLGGTLGYAIAAFSIGKVIAKKPESSFAITSIALLIFFITTLFMPNDDKPRGTAIKYEFKALFANKSIFFILLAAFVFMSAMGFYNAFLSVYVAQLGFDASRIGLLMSITALSEVPILLIIDRVSARLKTEHMLIFACIVLGLRLLLPLHGSFGALVLAQCTGGITYMIMYYSTVQYINRNLAVEMRGTGMAVLNVVQTGFANLFAMIVGGQIAQNLGLKSAFMWSSIMMFTFAIASLVWQFKKRANAKIATD